MTVVTICCDNWSGLPFPVPEDIPGPGIERMSLAWQANSLPLSHLGTPLIDASFTIFKCACPLSVIAHSPLIVTAFSELC